VFNPLGANLYRQMSRLDRQLISDTPLMDADPENQGFTDALVGELVKKTAFIERIMAGTPMMDSYLMEEKVDYLGYPITPDFEVPYNPGGINEKIKEWDDLYSKVKARSPAHEMILNRMDLFLPGNYRLAPSKKTITYGGDLYNLNPTVKNELSIRTAKYFGEMLNEFVQYDYDPNEKTIPLRKKIMKIRRKAIDRAKDDLLTSDLRVD